MPLVERDLQDNRFTANHRIRKSKDFARVFQSGHKIITPTLIFRVLPTELNESRLGLAVSRKVGKAVIRNKIRRRTREAFRLSKSGIMRAVDIVVSPRRNITEKTFEDYLESFMKLSRFVNRLNERA